MGTFPMINPWDGGFPSTENPFKLSVGAAAAVVAVVAVVAAGTVVAVVAVVAACRACPLFRRALQM